MPRAPPALPGVWHLRGRGTSSRCARFLREFAMDDPINRTPVLMAAYAVALSARTGSLTRHAVDDMRTMAEELLERDDDLRPAVFNFASQYELHSHDPVHVGYLGAALERAVRLASGLDQPRRERRDIDG